MTTGNSRQVESTSVVSCVSCQKMFVPRFSFQTGEIDGSKQHFCSQLCRQSVLSAGQVACDHCGTSFSPSMAFQVSENEQGGRSHFCTKPCRQAVMGIESTGGATVTQHAQPAPLPRAVVQQASENKAANTAQAHAGLPPPAPKTEPVKPKARKKARAIAVLNQKGGTGKTTTSVSVAAGLAAAGMKTLLLDFDPQGNVSVSLGVKSPRQAHHVMLTDAPLQHCWTEARENLYVISSDEGLAASEIELARMGAKVRTQRLKERLAALEDFDFVVIDCAPSLSLLNHNALVYAGEVLIPVSCDYLALVGVKQVLRTLRRVSEQTGAQVKVAGVLPTFFDVRNKMSTEVLGYLRSTFGARTLPPVRRNTKLAEAPSHRKTVYEHAGDSNGAKDYTRVVEWLRTGDKSSSAQDTRVA